MPPKSQDSFTLNREPDMLISLTERRKADRERMACELIAIAAQHGAAVDRLDDDARGIHLTIDAPGGLSVRLSLDGASCQPDTHVIPWHIGLDLPRGPVNVRLDPAFGEVNPYHFCKATHVARGWPALFANIDRGLRMAADGSAYRVAP